MLICLLRIFLKHLADKKLSFQNYFAIAIGKGKQAAKVEMEKFNLTEMTCREAVVEIAKMYHFPPHLISSTIQTST